MEMILLSRHFGVPSAQPSRGNKYGDVMPQRNFIDDTFPIAIALKTALELYELHLRLVSVHCGITSAGNDQIGVRRCAAEV